MAVTATVSFDKDVYHPGDIVTMTIVVDLPADTPPVTRTISGQLTLSTGEVLVLSGTVQLDHDQPVTIEQVAITETGALLWSAPTVSGNVVTLTAVA